MWRYNGKKRPEFANETIAGEESVWDYPRPPALSPDNRTIEVRWNGIIVAQTSDAIRLLETASPPGFYIPPGDVNHKLLEKSDRTTFCEWKGAASYYDLFTEGRRLELAAWAYENPNEAFAEIEAYISFYPGKIDCFVDGNKVEPQPGRFYGGWITPEVVGPFKGDPGTGGW